MKKEKKVFLISTEKKNNYAHIKIYIVKINEHGKPRNFSDTIYTWEGDKATEYYNGLCAYNQIGKHEVSEKCKSYGWEISYRNVYVIEKDKAKWMYKTLNSIDKKLHKIDENRSNPTSFGEYVGRVAETLKIKEFWFYKDNYSRNSDYDNNQYIVKNRSDGIDSINYNSVKLYEELKNKTA